MKNLDIMQSERIAILQKFSDAIKADDSAGFVAAFTELAQSIEESVKADAATHSQSADVAILAARGVRQLTSEETKFWQSAITGMKSADPKQAFTGTDNILPKTTIDAIFADLVSEHPLLDAISFENTGALAEILVSTTSGVAAWGELTATIASELAGAFAVIDLGLKKLSAFIPVSKAMLDLGPIWLDKYARGLLSEALAAELEAAIVDGDGKTGPLGMTRALTGATDGVYPRKTQVAVTDLGPVTFGTLANTISQGPNSKRRAVPEILMVVNPADYYTKVFPAVTPRAADGTYNYDVFPYPVKKVISPAVPAGGAVFGLAKRYFFGLGTSKGGKLEFSDEYKFLEDQRIYLVKLYGNGKPLDANAFVYADISGLVPVIPAVTISGTVATHEVV